MSTLLIGGDWACAHGDLGTLAHDAELLAVCLAEPLRAELLEVVHLCHHDYVRAAERWCAVREHLRTRLRGNQPALHASS